MVTATFLGTGGAGSKPYRKGMCIALEWSGGSVLLDIGEGCGASMEMMGVDLSRFDAVFVSHRHHDHFAGLFDAVVRSPQLEELKLILHPSTARDIEPILPYSITRKLRDRCRIVAVTQIELGNARMELFEAKHPVPAASIIIEVEDRRILYTGDTALTNELVKHIATVDAAIVECALPRGERMLAETLGHLTVEDLEYLRSLMDRRALMIVVHTTKRSEYEVMVFAKRFRNVLVPSDLTAMSI